jgi:hypothetical protein
MDARNDEDGKQPCHDSVDREQAQDDAQPGRQVITVGETSYWVHSDGEHQCQEDRPEDLGEFPQTKGCDQAAASPRRMISPRGSIQRLETSTLSDPM